MSYPVRSAMRLIFSIPKTHGAEMYGSKLVSDGCTNEDLQAVSLSKMQAYTGLTSEDFYDQLNETIGKIEKALKEEDQVASRAKLEAEKARLEEIEAQLEELSKMVGKVEETVKKNKGGRPKGYSPKKKT